MCFYNTLYKLSSEQVVSLVHWNNNPNQSRPEASVIEVILYFSKPRNSVIGVENELPITEPELIPKSQLTLDSDYILEPPLVSIEAMNEKQVELPAEPELNLKFMEALGETTYDTPKFGTKIHDSLAKLWLPLLTQAMPKDKKENLRKEYIIPENCRLLQAPKLNAEISMTDRLCKKRSQDPSNLPAATRIGDNSNQ